MNFGLCAGCRHRFPVDSLLKADYSDQIGWQFDKLHKLIHNIEPHSSAEKDTVCQIQVVLQELCAMVQEESCSLRARLQAKESLKTLPAVTKGIDDKSTINAMIVEPFNSTSQHDSKGKRIVEDANVTYSSKINERLNHTQNETNELPSLSLMESTLKAAPITTKATASQVLSTVPRKLISANELVSATIYSIIQSVAVLTRADSAVLWLKPHGFMSNELIGSFAFGRAAPASDAVYCTAPYHVKDDSLPCAVASTGVALNMQPCFTNQCSQNGNTERSKCVNSLHHHKNNSNNNNNSSNYSSSAQHYNTNTETQTQQENVLERGVKHRKAHLTNVQLNEMTLLELIKYGEVAQLLMPVFSRYRVESTEVVAVLHLIGSVNFPFPFSRRNEVTVLHSAQLLSIILSSYSDAMLNEWSNHFYDPAVLVSSEIYSSELDVRSDAKCMDDFAMPSLLIYRANASYRDNGVDERDFAKGMKTLMARNGVPVQQLVGMKDLYRHVTNVENYWASSVKCNTEMSKMMTTLEEKLLSAEVQNLRKDDLSESQTYSSSLDTTLKHTIEPLCTNDRLNCSYNTHVNNNTLLEQEVAQARNKELERMNKLNININSKSDNNYSNEDIRASTKDVGITAPNSVTQKCVYKNNQVTSSSSFINTNSTAAAATTTTTAAFDIHPVSNENQEVTLTEKAAAKRDSQVSSDTSMEVKLTSPVKAQGDINLLLSTAPVLKPEEVEQLEGMVRKRLETMNSALVTFETNTPSTNANSSKSNISKNSQPERKVRYVNKID